MRGLFGFAILSIVFVFALFIFYYFSLPLPPTLIGIITLFCILIMLRRVPSSINQATRPLLMHMGLFLLPAMISVMLFLDVFATYFIALVGAIVMSTIFSLALTLWLSQRILNGVKASSLNNGENHD
jgi:holin-like protein